MYSFKLKCFFFCSVGAPSEATKSTSLLCIYSQICAKKQQHKKACASYNTYSVANPICASSPSSSSTDKESRQAYLYMHIYFMYMRRGENANNRINGERICAHISVYTYIRVCRFIFEFFFLLYIFNSRM